MRTASPGVRSGAVRCPTSFSLSKFRRQTFRRQTEVCRTFYFKLHHQPGLLVVGLLGLSMLAGACGRNLVTGHDGSAALTEDEKHRVYPAALAVSDAPLDGDLLKSVCRKLDIFDTSTKPNQQYLKFISDHIQWSMEPDNRQFGHEISTPEKAREYIRRHLQL